MKKGLVILGAVLLFAACKKNNDFPSVPQISLKSVNPDVVPYGGTLIIDLGFKDKEGDIQDTVFLSKYIDGVAQFSDSPYPIPTDVPQQHDLQGDIILTLGYLTDIGQPQNGHPDTAVFSMYMKDLAGHISDTVKTGPVIIEAQ